MPSQPKIQPLTLDGLNGRLMRVSAQGSSNQEILLIYGIHSSLERMQSSAEFLSAYGNVTMPDLPGIGGMDSFYRIGLKPTLDDYADYLHDFIVSANYKKPIKTVAMSFGFLVLARMLQKYPDTRASFSHIISFVGFGRCSDFRHHTRKRIIYWPMTTLFSSRGGGWFAKNIMFNPKGLKLMFGIFKLFNPKYKHGMKTDPAGSQAMELDLWQKNDARTRFYIYKMLFKFDLTNTQERLKMPLHDMTTPTDQYLEHSKVEKSLKLLFDNVTSSEANMELHAPSVIGTTEEVTRIFSDEVKAVLALKAGQ